MMPIPHWWGLRRKFRAAIPREVTNTYLAAALGMGENSAAANIMPTLKSTGIIDKDNKPTDLAVRWRDDAQYPAVCNEIRKAVYPQELLDLAPDRSVGRQVIQTWFANHTGLGESGASKMAAFYVMLVEADPAKQAEIPQQPGATAKPATKPSRQPAAKNAAVTDKTPAQHAAKEVNRDASLTPKRPDLRINVQIHIAADAPTDQIDQIFASMAKHLKDFG
jgi:ribosomal protein S25